nr:ribonuclease BN [Acetivibrio thermocellus]
MRGSIFRTIKLLILTNIFLTPFVVAVQNIAIRFIIGLLIGFSFIILLSFTSKIQKMYEKGKLK